MFPTVHLDPMRVYPEVNPTSGIYSVISRQKIAVPYETGFFHSVSVMDFPQTVGE